MSGKPLAEMTEDEEVEALHERLSNLAREQPLLVRFLCRLVEKIEELDADVDDVSAMIRLYNKSQVLFRLLLDMLSVVGDSLSEDSETAADSAEEGPGGRSDT